MSAIVRTSITRLFVALGSVSRVSTFAMAAEPRVFDLVVIGGGSAGLTAAKFARTFDKSVLIVERAKLGGDCTWTGCVPSKTLIASAKRAHDARTAARFGVNVGSVSVDFDKVRARVAAAIEQIYDEDDSPAALAKLGIETMTGAAKFADAQTLEVHSEEGEQQPVTLRARDGVVIATGASPRVPELPGLETVSFITYEEVFSLPSLPVRLTVVGGGPIGAELAQAFSRLGSKVTLVATRVLPSAEPEAGAALAAALEAEGITIVRDRASRVSPLSEAPAQPDAGHTLVCAGGASISGDVLLLATGRAPVVNGLDLERAGVKLNAKGGIQVDAKLRTTAPNVYAAGDCTGDRQFTHYAGFQGAIAARNALLPLADPGVVQLVPGCTFTVPEVASIGLTEAEAVEQLGAAKVATAVTQLNAVDRAICDGSEEHGLIKLVYSPKDGKLLGATIVAPPAGELINEISVAISAGVKMPKLASMMHAYPSYGMAIQQMAASVYYETLKKSAPLYAFLKKLGL